LEASGLNCHTTFLGAEGVFNAHGRFSLPFSPECTREKRINST
jgi:hypothetical protein